MITLVSLYFILSFPPINSAFRLVTFAMLLFTCITPEAVFDNWTNLMESATRLQTGATPGRRCQPPHPRERELIDAALL